ncbi:hypothetical protein PFICI_10820 [Pestalotiopsis fici W106-1]|uniref:Thiaminase-2/PQQC domain-containing protein n=1 Tax=Pestalotiopsis fici (strain W106-1 / CGMCC3.15140) TaxID=1229662 RepID=W3WVR9_PESFW|nr:uncharacterized protein PFICI_10820 [Pestalotiopsis fici W106-1]ETS76946.1 hypothetical protein PFICI_10820 [Pestalotiopsis fici W106-1]
MPSLTARLLSHPQTPDAYKRATQSPFLQLAGQGRLPPTTLSQWLAQDRLYAQAYARFIGGLLSRVRLPVRSDRPIRETLEWRVVQVLKSSLDGILVELAFFEDTAAKYGLDLAAVVPAEKVVGSSGGGGGSGKEFGPNPTTAAYVDLFDSFGAGGNANKSVFEGLVLLWATEKVYHEAWTYARDQGQASQTKAEDDLDGGALRKEFIPNWTSAEFGAFVDEIEACLDQYAETHSGADVDETALRVWKEVLQLEQGFWPQV